MSEDTLDLIKDIKYRRMPIEYKTVVNKLRQSKPFKHDDRSVYYKIGDEIVLEIYNSGTKEKPYIKGFFNQELWYGMYKYLNCAPDITKLFKGITIDILGIKCSSIGRKIQEEKYFFHLK